MAITRETLQLLDGMRISLNSRVDAASERIILAWATTWNEIAAEWQSAIDDLVASSQGGAWPSRAKVSRARRAQRALEVTREALHDLSRDLPITVTQALPRMTDDAADWARRLAGSQYPPQAGGTLSVAASFDRSSPDALKSIVQRTTGRIHSASQPLSGQAERAMKSTLIRGIALGDNPRTTAAQMLQRVERAFNGGRNRALVLARTEMLDAHRAASLAQEKAMADVLQGWTWCAQLDNRTCPGCWGQHGTEHAPGTPGPLDHQQGRCARLPLTKSWKDIGFPNVIEPPSLLPDAEATFGRLTPEDQLTIMGKARLDLLQSGQVGWTDLAQRRRTDGWRDSFAPAPVATLRATAKAAS